MRYKLVLSNTSLENVCSECCLYINTKCSIDSADFFLKHGDCTDMQKPLRHFVICGSDKINNKIRVL